MYFCTYEHYDDVSNYNNSYDENNNMECFICFEIKIINETQPIKLKKQTLYLRECNCDSYVHKSCLKTWFDHNKNCPICRKIVRENNLMILTFNWCIQYETNLYLFITSIDVNIFKILSVYLFIYLVFEIYLTEIKINSIHKFDNINYNNYNNTFNFDK